MRHRLNALGLPQVQASTFHAAARRQLAYYWPLVHGQDLPEVLDSKLAILIPLARQLPGGYKFTPAKDLADEIEWAKVRRQRPEPTRRSASRPFRLTSSSTCGAATRRARRGATGSTSRTC